MFIHITKKRIMKRNVVFGILAALAVFGCQVKEEYEFAPEGKVFTATTEAYIADGVETKTSMDSEGNVLWKRGDQVSIFAASTLNEHYQVTDASDGKTAAAMNKVEGTGFVAGGEIPNNVAFYPYAVNTGIAKKSGGYVISDIALPETQNYAEASFGNGAFPMVAVTASTMDYNLKFKNVLGCLKLRLTGTAAIASISITGNNNEILCGDAEVTVSTTTTPEISLTDASSTTVTLDCGDGVQLNETAATAFIIALPPMTMTGGFTVIVTDTQGASMEIKTTKTQTITRSNILAMPTIAANAFILTTGTENGYEWVNLGLPSGLKWATCNVGANAPEEYGDYFAWGETVPFYASGHALDETCYYWKSGKTAGYAWASYSFELGTDHTGPFSKYVTNSDYGTVDNKTTLDLEDDAARQTLGGNWRMPTAAEWTELKTKCTWTQATPNGVYGYLVTGPNGNSIFMPAAGCRFFRNFDGSGSYSDYWASSLDTDHSQNAWVVSFGASGVYIDVTERFYGQSVRAVLPY